MNLYDKTDKEIKNLLMTMDFRSHSLNKEEHIFLLEKYKREYRRISSKNEALIKDIEKLESEIIRKENKIKKILDSKSKIINDIEYIYNRDLTIKERFLGKAISSRSERTSKLDLAFKRIKKIFTKK